MNKTVTINGKSYALPEFSFKDLCDLEEMGFALEEFPKKPMSQGRIFAAFMMKCDLETATAEIEAHVKNGGAVSDIFDSMTDAITGSDFFRNAEQEKKKAGQKKQSGVNPSKA